MRRYMKYEETWTKNISDETRGNEGIFERERGRESFLYFAKWVKIFIVVIALAVSLLDPFFFYIPVIENDRKCISLDKKLETIVIVFRSLVDLFYAIYIVIRLHSDFFAPCYLMYREGELVEHLWKISNKYLLRAFLLDFLSAFPLPQVVILFIVPAMGGSRFLKAIYLLRSVVLFQYVPRFFRTYSLVTSGAFGEPAKARAMFSPLLFVLGIHGIGGLWYFLSIERLAQCWNKACENHVGCFNLFRCKDNNIGEHTFLNDFCPRDAHKTEFFDFGMFSNAVESRVVETTDFPKKLLYCLHWGLLSLSCFGQNIQTGTYVWENVFTIFIIIFGLLLFLMLLGNLQAYLQSRSVRKEETRRQAREMEHWMPFKLVPEHLKSEVWSYLRYNWLESIGDDMEKFLANLPVGLTDRIKSELYLKLVKRVPMFDKMDESLLKALCDRLKTVFYSRERYIILEGEAITEMVFINQGTVLSVATKGGRTGFFNSVLLKYGDFFGEELVFWALDPGTYSRLPFSTRTFRALEEVTAFTLKAEDMKVVASYFVRLHGKEFIHIFRFYSQQWRTWAACFIQAAWRRYQKRKLEASLQQEENRLQDALAKLGGNSPSLGATIYASRFTANALGAIRRNSYRKARMLERTPLILLQKPAQPDFAGHEQ